MKGVHAGFNGMVTEAVTVTIQDLCMCNLLLQEYPDSAFCKRAYVRALVVHLESWFSCMTYNVEFLMTLDRYNPKVSNLLSRWACTSLSEVEQQVVIDSRKNNVNATNLKKTIRLVEKVIRIAVVVDFGKELAWIGLHSLFERRNRYTHPKDSSDLDVDDFRAADFEAVGRFCRDELWRLSRCFIDLFRVIRFNYCADECRCSWSGTADAAAEYSRSLDRLRRAQS